MSRGDAGAAINLIRQSLAQLRVVEGVVAQVHRLDAVEFLAGDEAVEVDLQRAAQAALEIVVRGVPLEAHGDVVEPFTVAVDRGFDVDELEPEVVGREFFAAERCGLLLVMADRTRLRRRG